MQPLSRVKTDAITVWGEPDTMARRPDLALKIANCITHWSEIEVILGAFLAFLLHANEKAALAMYTALENRAAQVRIITAAAKSRLPAEHSAVISELLSKIIGPAMKERDRIAHWNWGYSDDLPDALLLQEPAYTLRGVIESNHLAKGNEQQPVGVAFDHIYVITSKDLDGVLKRSYAAKRMLRIAMASVWERNSPEERAGCLQQLSSEPQIQAALKRPNGSRNAP